MDVRQKQNLLQYLGYYEGNVDGISGDLTEQAVAEFRTDNGNPNLGDELEEVLIGAVFHAKFKQPKEIETPVNVVAPADYWDTVQYFGRHEFACKCGKCGGYPVEPSEKLIRVLDVLRGRMGVPIYVNSGVRCNAHNVSVGGSKGSRHIYGDAADIRSDTISPKTMYEAACALLPDGGVVLYSWGIHVDTRGYKARWNG
jgi:hypothetical protein